MFENSYKQVVCKDGFTMSVQASSHHYCMPRLDNVSRYAAVEIGFPSEAEPLLIEYAEDPDDPTGTVYAYVPSDRVSLVIAKHGGMISGQVPPGVAELKSAPVGEN